MSSREQQQAGKSEGEFPSPQKQGGRNVWLIRFLVGATILTVLTLGGLAFGAVAIPTVLLGGGLLLLLSPLLLGGAVLTSPIWVPIGGILLAVPPILATLAVATISFVMFLYWVVNFFCSRKTREAGAELKEAVKEATYCVQHRVYDTCQKAAQAGQQARSRAHSATESS